MAISAHHPFRSAAAKERYLEHYARREKDWPAAAESRLVQTSYGETFVRIGGPAAAEPLVLLHGAASSSLQWLSNIETLSEHYRTYAVDDFYGCGRSRAIRPIRGAAGLVAWLDELLGALGLGDNINFVGLSYGAWLISQYTLRFPDRVNKLVLLAPAAVVLPIRAAVIARAVISFLPHRLFARNFFCWMFADLARKDSRLTEDMVDAILLARSCFKPRRPVRPTVLTAAELCSMNKPLLFLFGENEKLYSPWDAVQRLNEVVPRVKTEVIPGAGHDLAVVQAQQVNTKILEFLQRP
ncbi:MAG: alpha/beta fold hydrolase [Negativicutes bacterium]|nr:alpha/beta fold hydrolase [Negativicutes bacterium]